jgi:hypothetical protein
LIVFLRELKVDQLSVKDRMNDMLMKIEESGETGISLRELLKIFYEKWGFRLYTIKGYVSDLKEIGKVRIVGSQVYHSKFHPPPGLFGMGRKFE